MSKEQVICTDILLQIPQSNNTDLKLAANARLFYGRHQYYDFTRSYSNKSREIRAYLVAYDNVPRPKHIPRGTFLPSSSDGGMHNSATAEVRLESDMNGTLADVMG
jgi:hypothetical protein